MMAKQVCQERSGSFIDLIQGYFRGSFGHHVAEADMLCCLPYHTATASIYAPLGIHPGQDNRKREPEHNCGLSGL